MLLELILKDFVLVKQAHLSLSKGLTVITGETGAGKSLLVQAMKLLLGAKASAAQVRPGAKQAVIQGIFEPDPQATAVLDELGIPQDDELIVRRIVPQSGRGRIFVNGIIVTLQDLRRITGALVSISGQHDYQSLLKKDAHRIWLDRFCGLDDQVGNLSRLYYRLQGIRKRLEDISFQKERTKEEAQQLSAQIERIDQLGPRPGEDAEIEKEVKILRSSQRLKELGARVYSALYAGKGSVYEVLHQCIKDMDEMAGIDSGLVSSLEDLRTASYQVQDVAYTLRDYISELDSDPERLNLLEQRLYELKELMRSYGPSIEEVLAYRNEIDKRLQELSVGDKELERLNQQIEQIQKELMSLAQRISEARAKGAQALSRKISGELAGLNLEQVRFEAILERPAAPSPSDIGPYGFDRVEFLFSSNPGQPLRPLAAIASGGELSRVMLAVKTALSSRISVETLVFDEIDAGIGGEVANLVGERLKELARSAQVITITHFPQIASVAQDHFKVIKKIDHGKSVTKVDRISGQERIKELMRMLGGKGEAAERYAQKLLFREAPSGG